MAQDPNATAVLEEPVYSPERPARGPEAPAVPDARTDFERTLAQVQTYDRKPGRLRDRLYKNLAVVPTGERGPGFVKDVVTTGQTLYQAGKLGIGEAMKFFDRLTGVGEAAIRRGAGGTQFAKVLPPAPESDYGPVGQAGEKLVQSAASSEAMNFEQSKDLSDLWNHPMQYAQTIAANIPNLAELAVAYKFGKGAGVGAAIFGMENQAGFDEARGAGATPEQANLYANVKGASAAIAVPLPAQMVKRAFGVDRQAFYKSFGDRLLQVVKGAPADVVKSAFSLGGYSAIQQGVGELSANAIYGQPIAGGMDGLIDRMVQSFKSGAILGGTLGVAGAVTKAVSPTAKGTLAERVKEVTGAEETSRESARERFRNLPLPPEQQQVPPDATANVELPEVTQQVKEEIRHAEAVRSDQGVLREAGLQRQEGEGVGRPDVYRPGQEQGRPVQPGQVAASQVVPPPPQEPVRVGEAVAAQADVPVVPPEPPPGEPQAALPRTGEGQGKQPWEMRRYDYQPTVWDATEKRLAKPQTRRRVSYRYVDPAPAGPFVGKTMVPDGVKKGDIISAMNGKARVTSVGKPEAAESRKPTGEEVANAISDEHLAAVGQALREGKPVPRAVLEDYRGQSWADEALAKMEGQPATGTAPPSSKGTGPWADVSWAGSKLAAKLGVELSTVKGTGKGGRVTSADVRKAAQQQKAQPTPAEAPVEAPPPRTSAQIANATTIAHAKPTADITPAEAARLPEDAYADWAWRLDDVHYSGVTLARRISAMDQLYEAAKLRGDVEGISRAIQTVSDIVDRQTPKRNLSERAQKELSEYRKLLGKWGRAEIQAEPTRTSAQIAKEAKKRIISDESMAKAAENIRTKLGPSTLHAGIDPTVLKDMAVYGLGLVERGATEFVEWAARMVKDFGDAVKPHVEELWQYIREGRASPKEAARTIDREAKAGRFTEEDFAAAQFATLVADAKAKGASSSDLMVAFKLGEKSLAEMRDGLIEWANKRLPVEVRGKALAAINRVKTGKGAGASSFVRRVLDILGQREKRDAISALTKLTEKARKLAKTTSGILQDKLLDELGDIDLHRPNAKTVATLTAMDEWYKRQAGQDATPRHILNEIALKVGRLELKPLADMTLDEIQARTNMIARYVSQIELKQTLGEGADLREKQTVAGQINAEMLDKRRTWQGYMDEYLKSRNPLKQAASRAYRFANTFWLRNRWNGEAGLSRMGETMHQIGYLDVLKGRENQLADIHQQRARLADALNAIGYEWGSRKLARLPSERVTVKLAGGEVEMTKAEVISIMGQMQQPNIQRQLYESPMPLRIGSQPETKGGVDTLQSVDLSDVQGLRDQFPDLWKITEAVRDNMGELTPALNAASIKLEGYAKFLEESYWTIRTSGLDRIGKGEEPKANQLNRIMLPEHAGYTQERTGHSGTIMATNAFNVWADHLHWATSYIHQTENLRRLMWIMNGSMFRKLARQQFGQQMMGETAEANSWLFRRVQAVSQQARPSIDEFDNLMSKATHNLAVAYLGLRLTPAAVQSSGLATMAVELDPNPVVAHAMLWRHGIPAMFQPSVWTEMFENAPILRERYEASAARLMGPEAGQKGESLGRRGLASQSMRLLNLMDSANGVAGYAVFKEQVRAEHPDWTEAQVRKEAGWRTTLTVSRTQNPVEAIDYTDGQLKGRTSPFFRALVQFRSDNFAVGNMMYRAWRAMIEAPPGQKAAATVKFAHAVLMGTAVRGIWATAIRYGIKAATLAGIVAVLGLKSDDEERKKDKLNTFYWQAAQQSLQAFPGAQGAAQIAQALSGKPKDIEYRLRQAVQVDTPVTRTAGEAVLGLVDLTMALVHGLGEGQKTTMQSGPDKGKSRAWVAFWKGLWETLSAGTALGGVPNVPFMLRNQAEREMDARNKPVAPTGPPPKIKKLTSTSRTLKKPKTP
ncbi:MAG: E3 binding domain-containing protein [Planctomycetota bacterium]